MLIDRYAVETELGGELKLVEVAIVELVPFLRIEIGVRQHHPGGAIFVGKTHVQIRIGHEMKHEAFHPRPCFPRLRPIVRPPARFASAARLAGVSAKPLGWCGRSCLLPFEETSEPIPRRAAGSLARRRAPRG